MNKESFSYELTKLVQGYIDDELNRREFDDNPYHHDDQFDGHDERITLIQEYAKHRKFVQGIEMILENPLFEIDKEEFMNNNHDNLYTRHVYLNIQMLYEELKALGSFDKI